MKLQYMITVCILIMFCSCGKEFLEIRYDMSVMTPQRIADYQAMLDNAVGRMNSNSTHGLSLIGGEEYHIASADWHGVPITSNRLQQKNAYIWAADIYEGELGTDWNNGYAKVLQANLVLDGMKDVTMENSEKDAYNNVVGSALFFRALTFYQLAQMFCKPFNSGSATADLGIPLRLEADVTIKSKRATLGETYEKIVDDLIEAAGLLPDMPGFKVRPSKAAAYALLAKTYLHMGEYEHAEEYANKSLIIHDALIDFNMLSFDRSFTFPNDYGTSNEEVVFLSYAQNMSLMSDSRMDVNNGLLELYSENDLRVAAFYRESSAGNTFFRGSYYGNAFYFTGISTAEILLVRAECYARNGKEQLARSDLRRLRLHRFKTGTSVFDDRSDVLKAVLEERRRELPFRGLRWEDLRRLSQDDRFAITIQRQIDDVVYELKPEDPKYVWPIPQNAIELGGVQQNER